MTTCPHCGHALTKTRGTRLPEDWEPTMVQLTWAANERADLNAKSQAAMFRDYWHAKPGKDGVKLDWAATWRNWIRNAHVTPQSQRMPKPASFQRAGSVRRMSDSDRAKTVGEHLPAIMRQLGMKV